MEDTRNAVGTHPAPSADHWNWCSRCGCSVDDDMRTGEFRDGSEGTCLGCGTVYVAEAMTDGSWGFREEPCRPAGCLCTWEFGDSECPVHPTCPGCGCVVCECKPTGSGS